MLLGLFNRAIGESGTVLAEWALDRNGRGKAGSLQIAQIAGCPLEPYQALLSCVQNLDPAVLTDAYGQYAVYSLVFLLVFCSLISNPKSELIYISFLLP